MTGETDFGKGAAILHKTYPNIKVLNVTAGADGSYSFYGEEEPVFVPSFQLGGTIETTGAGDTFCASVLNYILENGIVCLTPEDRKTMLALPTGRPILSPPGRAPSAPCRNAAKWKPCWQQTEEAAISFPFDKTKFSWNNSEGSGHPTLFQRERKAVAMEKSVFATRLDHCYNELKWLYCELYHNDRGAFDYLFRCWRHSGMPERMPCGPSMKSVWLSRIGIAPTNCWV